MLTSGKTFEASEWLIPYAPRGDGVIEDHWFNVTYQPLREADGGVLRVMAVCNDVTQQVLARRELERANRELEQFAYVASHDLQEPPRMIGIYTALLLRRHLGNDHKAGEYANFVRAWVARMEELIHDLLTYSETIRDNDAACGSADLNESLVGAVKSLDATMGKTHATVKSETLPNVRGDASELMIVFQNLLSNSLKYHRKGFAPEIEVSSRRQGEEWIISVRDNGIGFDPRYERRIFGLFKRLHKDEFPGTGLGLAICERIIERYGGRIWAEGRLGEGATFHLALAEAR